MRFCVVAASGLRCRSYYSRSWFVEVLAEFCVRKFCAGGFCVCYGVVAGAGCRAVEAMSKSAKKIFDAVAADQEVWSPIDLILASPLHAILPRWCSNTALLLEIQQL